MSSVWIGTSDPTGVPATASYTTLDPPQRVWMNAVPIAWNATDDAIRALAARTTGSNSVASSSSSATTPTSTPTSTGTPDPPSAGLSTDAKVAIGVCVLLAAIVGVLLAVFLVRRSKKQKTAHHGREEHTTREEYQRRIPEKNTREEYQRRIPEGGVVGGRGEDYVAAAGNGRFCRTEYVCAVYWTACGVGSGTETNCRELSMVSWL
jgi:hypothetical protein